MSVAVPARHTAEGAQLSTSYTPEINQQYHQRPLQQISEVQDWLPQDYLAQYDGAEFNNSALQSFNGLENFIPTPESLFLAGEQPSAESGIPCLTNGSISEPMSRNNTNDVLSEPLLMCRLESVKSHMKMSPKQFPVDASKDASLLFCSALDNPVDYPDAVDFLSVTPTELKQCPSTGRIDTTSLPTVHTRITQRVSEQNSQGSRPLAPKNQNDATGQPPAPKLKAFKNEDGTIVHKAEIARHTRQQAPRKTTFCRYCNDQPQGFHGDHELRRRHLGG